MATVIRLKRMGTKKKPFYRLVVTDSRRAVSGRFIETLGYYDPRKEPAILNINGEKALAWLKKGAKPSDTVRSLFQREGVLLRRRGGSEKMRNGETMKRGNGESEKISRQVRNGETEQESNGVKE